MNKLSVLIPPIPHPTDASIYYLWGDWSSLAERSSAERLPCLLSLIIHTQGEGHDTLTHTHTLSVSPVVHTHTHLDLRSCAQLSDLAYIIHAAETDQTPMHTCWNALLCFSHTVCVLHDTHTLTHSWGCLLQSRRTLWHALRTRDWINGRVGNLWLCIGLNYFKAFAARRGEKKQLKGGCLFLLCD